MSSARTMLADTIAWLAANAPGARLCVDSRRVEAGDVFIALAADSAHGIALDGRGFIDDAIARGARAVIHDAAGFTWDARRTVPHVACKDLRSLAGPLANAHYGQPDAGMFTVAVTGTNGKTSCSQWLGAALSREAGVAAVIGTFGVGLYKNGCSNVFDSTGYTTPDAVQLQAALAGARDAGATALAIEASSIGLQQARMRGMHVDVALLTNLTRDHLDYHGDMAAYEAAKTILFDWPGLRHAVLNLDDPMGARIAARLRERAPAVRITGYTIDAAGVVAAAALAAFGPDDRWLAASSLHAAPAGVQFQWQCMQPAADAAAGSKLTVRTQLVGDFNVSNVLGVLGVLLAHGMTQTEAITAIEALQPVAGRMQQIGGTDQPLVVIDYAHTPDALEKTLVSLRQVAGDRQGALWCVFGCGGDRDPGKRPQMGAISRAADHVVVTSDNPRSEVPGAIMAEIVAGFDESADASLVHGAGSAAARLQVIEDRASAILWALRHAGKNDVVLLAGKGHENTQEIRGRKLQFLDADHAALALAARATMKGPA